MITNETTQVIQPEKFWWNDTPNKELFNQKGIIYLYDPYTVKFEAPTYPEMIRVRCFVYFDVLLGNTQLIDAGEITDYHIRVNIETDIEKELRRIAFDAHTRFMVTLEEHRLQSCISPTYTPTFDPEALERKLQSVLRDGD